MGKIMISDEIIAAAKAALAALERDRPVSTQSVIMELADGIRAARASGHKYSEIAEVLQAVGINVRAATLSAYLSGKRRKNGAEEDGAQEVANTEAPVDAGEPEAQSEQSESAEEACEVQEGQEDQGAEEAPAESAAPAN